MIGEVLEALFVAVGIRVTDPGPPASRRRRLIISLLIVVGVVVIAIGMFAIGLLVYILTD
jgi:hypothetical protein